MVNGRPTSISWNAGRAIGRGFLLPASLPLALAACVAGTAAPLPAPVKAPMPNPRYATFSCGGGEQITLEDFGPAVHVIDSRGPDMVLPASPPAQTTRYGQRGYALVLRGGVAVWAVAGKPSLRCVS